MGKIIATRDGTKKKVRYGAPKKTSARKNKLFEVFERIMFSFVHRKMGSRSFLSLQMQRLAQTRNNVASECHMHWALQGARGHTVLNEKTNDCTSPTTFNPGNTIKAI